MQCAADKCAESLLRDGVIARLLPEFRHDHCPIVWMRCSWALYLRSARGTPSHVHTHHRQSAFPERACLNGGAAHDFGDRMYRGYGNDSFLQIDNDQRSYAVKFSNWHGRFNSCKWRVAARLCMLRATATCGNASNVRSVHGHKAFRNFSALMLNAANRFLLSMPVVVPYHLPLAAVGAGMGLYGVGLRR